MAILKSGGFPRDLRLRQVQRALFRCNIPAGNPAGGIQTLSPPGCCASPLCRKYGGGRPEGNSPGFFRRTGEDAGSAE